MEIRKYILMLLVILPLYASGQIKMMLASDPHVMSKELFDLPYGQAFLNYMGHDLKAMENSQQLFGDFTAKVIKEHPDILLLPGDLTKDGELVSHQYVSSKLDEVRKAGIKVYVIPGNHDMENPCAYQYKGDKTEKVPSVSEKEFVQMYYQDGYAQTVMTDTLSNSYMVYPKDGLALICINSIIPNKYKYRAVHGRVSSRLLRWVENAAAKARQEHRMVLGMMHHEILEHHDQTATFIPTAMVNMEKIKGQPSIGEVRNSLRRAGIEVLFTGHYHIQSIKTASTLYGSITDITTGALSGYPSPYRSITLDLQKGTMKVTSATMFGNATSKWPDTDLSRKEADRLKYMVRAYVPKITKTTDMDEAYKYLAEPFGKALCALAAGDEQGHSPKKIIDECMKAWDNYVCHALQFNVIEINKLRTQKNGPYTKLRSLFTSIMYNYVNNRKNNTPDNTYTIKLKEKVV